nr:uncharacterized protein LOC109153397 [Ipomoea batatas]
MEDAPTVDQSLGDPIANSEGGQILTNETKKVDKPKGAASSPNIDIWERSPEGERVSYKEKLAGNTSFETCPTKSKSPDAYGEEGRQCGTYGNKPARKETTVWKTTDSSHADNTPTIIRPEVTEGILGGEVIDSETICQIGYTIPPQRLVYVYRYSSFSDVIVVIRNAMGESPHTILELTARLLVYTEQQGLFHKQYPIVSDDSWLYFVNQMSRLGELHVYVTTTTNSSFMGLLTGLTQFSEGGSGSSSYNICSSSEPFVDFSHYAQTEQNSDSSTSSSEEEIEPTSDHSNGEDGSLSQQVSLRRGKAHIPDADILYYHTYFSFGQGYKGHDDDYTPLYSSTKNVLQVGMVFDGYEELKKVVSLHNIVERKQFKSAFKDRQCWKAICLHKTSGEQPYKALPKDKSGRNDENYKGESSGTKTGNYKRESNGTKTRSKSRQAATEIEHTLVIGSRRGETVRYTVQEDIPPNEFDWAMQEWGDWREHPNDPSHYGALEDDMEEEYFVEYG